MKYLTSWSIHNRFGGTHSEKGSVQAPGWFFPKGTASGQWVNVDAFGDNVDVHENWKTPENATYFRIIRSSDRRIYVGDKETVYSGDIQYHGKKTRRKKVPKTLAKFVENLECGSNEKKVYYLQISYPEWINKDIWVGQPSTEKQLAHRKSI